jgi:hypothetical protein
MQTIWFITANGEQRKAEQCISVLALGLASWTFGRGRGSEPRRWALSHRRAGSPRRSATAGATAAARERIAEKKAEDDDEDSKEDEE